MTFDLVFNTETEFKTETESLGTETILKKTETVIKTELPK